MTFSTKRPELPELRFEGVLVDLAEREVEETVPNDIPIGVSMKVHSYLMSDKLPSLLKVLLSRAFTL